MSDTPTWPSRPITAQYTTGGSELLSGYKSMIRRSFVLGIRIHNLIAACLLLLLPTAAIGATLEGKVVHVADGDTITVLAGANQQYRIRLAGIDAPEKKQAYGSASKRHLAAMVAGRVVTVEWGKHDKYGRTVGKVLLEGQDICLAQINAGMAWHYKKYEREQPAADRKQYAAAEIDARNNRIGLWRDASPLPPWEYRHLPKTAQEKIDPGGRTN